jgi:hypothetical protein
MTKQEQIQQIVKNLDEVIERVIDRKSYEFIDFQYACCPMDDNGSCLNCFLRGTPTCFYYNRNVFYVRLMGEIDEELGKDAVDIVKVIGLIEAFKIMVLEAENKGYW